MKKTIKVFAALLLLPAVFMGGFLYNELIYHSNILCGSETPIRINRSLKYQHVTIHEGAVVSLRECNYSTSFSIRFPLPHAPLVGEPSPLHETDIEFLGRTDMKESEYAGAISDFSAWQEL